MVIVFNIAFEQGKRAWKMRGINPAKWRLNPYRQGTQLAREWEAGWDKAHEEHWGQRHG